MSRIIVTDSDTIQWLGYSNSPVAEHVGKTLREMRARGDTIHIVEQGMFETVEDPSLLPRTSTAHRELIRDAGFKVVHPPRNSVSTA